MPEERSETASADMHGVVTTMIRDMKIVGLFYIVMGAFNCLTIIGAIVGIPYIFAGLRIRESGESYLDWLNNEPGALFRALQKQQQHFFIMMVMMVIGLIFTVLMIALMGVLITAGILTQFD